VLLFRSTMAVQRRMPNQHFQRHASSARCLRHDQQCVLLRRQDHLTHLSLLVRQVRL
jgi:hypothetical protein